MRILFYRYNSICEPDVMMALKDLGHDVETIDLEIERKDLPPAETVLAISKKLDEKSYDAIFSINYYPAISKVAEIYHIRYISWTVDAPVMELWSNTMTSPWNRTFIFDLAEYNLFKDCNPGKVFHMPLASNVKRINALFEGLNGQRRFKEDISFVGSLYNEKNPVMKLPGIENSYLGGFLKAACTIQSKLYGGFILEDVLTEDIIEEFKKKYDGYYTPPETFVTDDRHTIASLYLAPWATTMERERIAELLYKYFRFGLYTRSKLDHLKVRGKGSVSTLVEMPQVFRNSVININMTHKGIRTGVPLRVFDIMAAGGFVLSGYQQEMFDIFTPGEDFDFFTTDDEMTEKCLFYLEHQNIAREMAENAYNKVKTMHSYQVRMEEILKLSFSI
ncbi:MAG: DUF3880 domain-containing protein [Lachnospiraceae bacterium]|nr:DUF3880 domain-containing protein [Lachnospiraceae bacterium]